MRAPSVTNPDSLDRDAVRLERALEGALIRAARRQNVLSVSTSGGLGSSVLAALLARHGEGILQLITVAAVDAPDGQRARRLARHLGLPLVEIVLTPARVRQALPRLVPLVGESLLEPDLAAELGLDPSTRAVNPLRVERELPLFLVAHEAAGHGPRLVVGQGADELLGGDARYTNLRPDELRAQLDRDLQILEAEILPVEARISQQARLRLQYPYLDARVKAVCRSISLSRIANESAGMPVLGRVAQLLALPEAMAQVAAAPRHGAGAAEILRGLAQQEGRRTTEFLAQFLR